MNLIDDNQGNSYIVLYEAESIDDIDVTKIREMESISSVLDTLHRFMRSGAEWTTIATGFPIDVVGTPEGFCFTTKNTEDARKMFTYLRGKVRSAEKAVVKTINAMLQGESTLEFEEDDNGNA